MFVAVVFMLMLMAMVMSVFFFVMVVVMFMLVLMNFVRMRVGVGHAISACMLVAMLIGEVDVELYASNSGFVRAGNMQVIAVKFELFQFVLEFVSIDAKIEQCADKHVAADAAENVQI